MNEVRKKPHRSELKPGELLCDHCPAKCCRYFALPIERPRTMSDFEFIRWYLLHEQATVFVEDDTWYLLVHTKCKHLLANNRCGIYDTRPQICRDYSTEECEYDDEWTYDQYFETPEQIFEYCEALFGIPDGPEFRTPKPNPLKILDN